MGRLKPAERRQIKLRILLSGPSNAGKTYSALRLAHGMADANEIALVDSENRRALYYAEKFGFQHLNLEPPFSPSAYIEAIAECQRAGMKVIILDSISHEWDGPGGCLEMVDRMGGKFQSWKKVTPLHQKFVHSMVYSSAHIIATTRRKQEYAIEDGDRGKKTVRKLGLKEVQRDGLEYEFTFGFDIQHPGHVALLSKDSDYFGEDYEPRMLDEALGKELAAWAGEGVVAEGPASPEPQEASEGEEDAPPVRLRKAILEMMDRHGVLDGPRRDEITVTVTNGKLRRFRDVIRSQDEALLGRYLTVLTEKLSEAMVQE